MIKLKEHTHKTGRQIDRDMNNPDHKKVEKFCKEFKNHFDMKGFVPANGFYEEAYSDANISIKALSIGNAPYLDAIISYFPEDDYFIIKWQDGMSKSVGWSDIEILSNVEGDDFRDCYKDLKEEISIYEEAYFMSENNFEED